MVVQAGSTNPASKSSEISPNEESCCNKRLEVLRKTEPNHGLGPRFDALTQVGRNKEEEVPQCCCSFCCCCRCCFILVLLVIIRQARKAQWNPLARVENLQHAWCWKSGCA